MNLNDLLRLGLFSIIFIRVAPHYLCTHHLQWCNISLLLNKCRVRWTYQIFFSIISNHFCSKDSILHNKTLDLIIACFNHHSHSNNHRHNKNKHKFLLVQITTVDLSNNKATFSNNDMQGILKNIMVNQVIYYLKIFFIDCV